MKIHSMGAELIHADGRTEGRTDKLTDTTKLIDAFRNFPEIDRKCKSLCRALPPCRTPSRHTIFGEGHKS